MLRRLRRRMSQARQVGMAAAARIVAARVAGGIRTRIDGFAAHVVPSGLGSRARERPMHRIMPAMPASASGSVLLDRAEGGRLELLGAVGIAAATDGPGAGLPRPWRKTAIELSQHRDAGLPEVDWHSDPNSGFRWPPTVRSGSIRYGEAPGVEIKWPWEVGRLQHLPPTARAAIRQERLGGCRASALIEAHVRDFVRLNPPGFGVQWICTMDVGIRIANMLVAVDLARAAGAGFSPGFLRLVAATARDHGRHIVRNLEWGDRLCSNHYLANIAGLLYVGAYLQDDPESSEWLAFAGREMVHQIRAQFHPEGSNFEASTSYHRLSSEMAVHSAALMLWISRNQPERAVRWWSGPVRGFHPSPAAPPTPKEAWPSGLCHPFDDDVRRRLAGMGRFTESILREDGSVPQVGDNDSGRFFRLEMAGDPYADIDDHGHLVRACRALFGEATPGGEEAAWMSRWLGDATLVPTARETSCRWPEFGLLTWRMRRFLCTFRCGHVGQLGNGGHAHCDQLSITVSSPAGGIIEDPGTGAYTPRPALRNELRSSACHSTVLVPGHEQGEWLPGRWGLFAMRDLAQARLVRYDEHGAAAEMFGGDATVRRQVEVHEHGLRVVDAGPPGSCANFVLGPKVAVERQSGGGATLRIGPERWVLRGGNLRIDSCPWSARYGHVGRTTRIRCDAGTCELTLE